MAAADPPTFLFGPFRLEVGERRLLRDGQPVPLTPKAFQTLVVLVENAGRLVTKEALMEAVWPGTFVAEVNLAHHVSVLRKALGPEVIETVAKSGYRFVAEVRVAGPAPLSPTEPSALPEPAAPAEPRRKRRPWVVVAAVAVGGALGVWLALRRPIAPGDAPPSAIRSLAVLPFRFLGPAEEREILGLGLAESLIARLSRVPTLIVRPLTAVAPFAESRLDPTEIGRKLEVDAVLEGSLQRDGSAVRVTAYLRRVSDRRPLWSGAVTDVSSNLFAAQEALSSQLVASLWPNVVPARRGADRPTDPIAYELYLEGRFFWSKRTEEGLLKAIAAFERAIDRDPGMAISYAAVADARVLLAYLTRDPGEHLRLARQALDQAVALDEELAEGHAVKGLYISNLEYDWEGAEREYRRAIELSPGHVTATHRLGELLGLLGRFEEGLALLRRARDMDPLSLIVGSDTAKVLFMASRFEEAAREARRVLELDPAFAQAHAYLGLALAGSGDRKGAIQSAEAYQSLEDNLHGRCLAASILALVNERRRAEAVLQEVRAADARGDHVVPLLVAGIHAGLGNDTEALDWLERGYRERSVLLSVQVNPGFRSVRTHPRFLALSRKLNLPSAEASRPHSRKSQGS